MQTTATSARPGRFDNRHSAWVARLKVLLPLIALAILSTVFLLADRGGPGAGADYAPGAGDETATGGRVARPDYSGVGRNGAALYLTADEAQPVEPGGEIAARGLRGTWEGTRGGRIVVTSDDGTLAAGGQTATLTGAVDVATETGFRLTSRRIDVDAAAGRLVSPGAVEGTGPPGRITAGAMQVTQVGDRPLITFTEGVKVVYDPEASDGG